MATPVPTDQKVHALATLVVTNLATDADVPINALTFGLVSAPAGVQIDSLNGVLTWTPSIVQAPSTNTIMVSVTDNNPWALNEIHLSATNSFVVNVEEFQILVQYTSGQLTFQFPTQSGWRYRVEFRDDLTTGTWEPLPGSDDLAGTGSTVTVTEPVGSASARFYRVVRIP